MKVNVRILRHFKELTQKELSIQTGLSLRTIQRIEYDEISDIKLGTAKILSDFFKVPIEVLFYGADYNEKKIK